MGWVSLGSLTLSYDWQSFPTEAIASETFRVIQNSRDIAMGFAIVSQYFPNGGRAIGRKVYPGNEPYIFDLVIPHQLQISGYVTRTIQAKMSPRTRTLGNWVIEVQMLE